MIQRRIAFSIAFALTLMLAGCGFHPRSELVIPPSLGPMKVISADPNSILAENLSRALTKAHVQPADPTATKFASLRILGESWRQDPLSVDAFAHIYEYMITYTVTFAFTTADGTDLLPAQQVKLQRDFQYDDSHALGSGPEQDTIRLEMQRDMAANIFRSLDIVLRRMKP
jgi:LPS-assembly lipoprotein